jgi:DNA-binding MarR family transcriptional regulator
VKMDVNKDLLINNIHQLFFCISQNIEQNRIFSWIELNLSMSQFKALIYIEYQENVCVRDLSIALKMAQPNVTNLVDFLVKEGLVSREQNPGDRRIQVLKTTPKGSELIADLRESITSIMSGYLEKLSLDQLQTLNNGLNPLVKMMQERDNSTGVKIKKMQELNL